MKKYILLFLVTALVSSLVIAQGKAKTKAKAKQLDPFSVIFKAGLNSSIFSNPLTANSTFTQAKQVNGFNIGIYGNWPITPALSFQPGIKLTQKGSNVIADTPYYHVNSTIKPLYVEIPFNLVAKYQLSPDLHIYFGAGPYVAAAMGGKNSYAGTSGVFGYEAPFSGNDKIIFGNTGTPPYGETYGNMKKYDFGIDGLVGIQYWKFSLSVSYDFGLTDISYGTLTPNTGSKTKSMSLDLAFHL